MNDRLLKNASSPVCAFPGPLVGGDLWQAVPVERSHFTWARALLRFAPKYAIIGLTNTVE